MWTMLCGSGGVLTMMTTMMGDDVSVM
jgi:hypothetical protein